MLKKVDIALVLKKGKSVHVLKKEIPAQLFKQINLVKELKKGKSNAGA